MDDLDDLKVGGSAPSLDTIELRRGLAGDAWFSPCGTYRYRLERRVGPGEGVLVVIGLNPSTAGHEQDDPTIRRCIGFARREGLGTLRMLNLFAFRATDPAGLRRFDGDRFGPENHWGLTCGQAGPGRKLLLAAWGADGDAFPEHVAYVRSLLYRPLYCLGTTKSGQPRHPLFVRGDAPIVPWPGDGGPCD